MTEGLSELIGLPLWELPWVGSDGSRDDSARQRLKNAIASAARGDVIRYAERLERPGREAGRLDITLTPIKDQHGRIIYIVPEAREID